MADACGQIVRSLAGHDKGALFCVLDTDGGYLLLCDGKRRRLEGPNGRRRSTPNSWGRFPSPAWRSFRRASTDPTETYGGRWPLSELRN